MADIRLTAGDDTYVQPAADKNTFNNVYGEAGNDSIRMYQGGAHGGPGNDRFEQIADPDNPYRLFLVAYWSAGDNLRVHLGEGWAEDGEGGRDTLIGVRGVQGSNGKNAWVQGDAQDNTYWPNGGDDTFLGGAGHDTISLNSWFEPAPGQAWRQPVMGEFNIAVTADGRQATVTPRFGQGFSISVTDVESFEVLMDPATDTWNRFAFADFITPQTMAEGAVVAGAALRWGATQPLGSATEVSFSFVAVPPASGIGAPGFRAFTESERQLVRDILASTAQITQLRFTETTEAAGSSGQLRFGVSQQAVTKGQSYLPGTQGDLAGDVWMDVESMAGITPGSEGYQALLHEIGHALGLRHPRNVDAADAWGVQLREQDDRISLTVMSQTPSADGLFRADWGPLDVLALRHLYGVRDRNTGDTHVMLGSREGAAMTTVVDDGGVDTLDASQLPTGVSLDLVPGHTGSAGLTPAGFSGVDNLAISAGSSIEHAIGSAFDDVLLGNELANQLTGGLGNDWIDGGAGTDTAIFTGTRADHEIGTAFGKVYVTARDGIRGFDTLTSIEQLRFSDQTVTLSASPLGTDARFTTDEDGRLTSLLPDPTDVPRSAVSYRLVSGGNHGSATVSADGQLVYVPAANFWGRDAVSFEIVARGSANRYLGIVDVRPVNDAAPVARSAGYLALAERALSDRLPAATDLDGDAVSYSVASEPRNGALLLSADGSFSYTPKAGYSGNDDFTFMISDGVGGNNSYSATVRIAAADTRREGSAGADSMAPQSGSDAYFGLAGNDTITGGAGNDLIDGGDGVDTAVLLGNRSDYLVTRADFGWSVQASQGDDGTDLIIGVERLQFKDHTLAFDLGGNAGMVAQILRALFGPTFVSDKVFAGIGLSLADNGMSYRDLVALAVDTSVFVALAGSATNTAFVNHVYRNVVGSAPSADDLANFVGLLDSGAHTQASLGLLASQTSLNTDSVQLVGLADTGLAFTAVPG